MNLKNTIELNSVYDIQDGLKNINIVATAATGHTGYGSVGNEFIKLLYTRYTKNIELHTEKQHWFTDKCLHPEFKNIIIECINNRIEQPDLYFTLWNPSYLPHQTKIPSILETVFETDKIRDDWVVDCIRADITWVPSRFCERAFKNSGVDNVEYMPYGFNFYDTNETLPQLDNDKRFKFLFINQWSERKFAEQTVRTFCETFSKEDDVVLYIRADVSPGLESIGITNTTKLAQINAIKRDNPDSPQLILLDRVNDDTLLKLYNSVDCLLSPSRAEGVGRPMIEAMSMGVPVISTNWASMPEFINSSNGLLVDCEVNNIDLPTHEQNVYSLMSDMQWSTPNVDTLSKYMLDIIFDPEKTKNLGKQAKIDVRKQFNWISLFENRMASMEKIL